MLKTSKCRDGRDGQNLKGNINVNNVHIVMVYYYYLYFIVKEPFINLEKLKELRHNILSHF